MKRLSALLASAILLFGCDTIKEKIAGKAAEKAVETTTGGDVKISTGAGSLTGNAKMPEGWPSSVPQYPGSTVTMSASTPNGKTAILSTSDSAAKVHDFYKGKLSGMKQQSDLDLGQSKVLVFQDGASTVSVNIATGGDGKTVVTLSTAAR